MLSASSPPIASILATLDLANRFAFIIVIGPDEHPELARWSLAVHLAAMGQEVLWHSIADSDLDLPALIERASSANPVVIASGIEDLDPKQRLARFARMNLERDVWGQYAVRVVLWCSTEHIDCFQHVAPDLFHWRSLIQPLSAIDLCVFDRTTYLAWIADECAERSDDRVLRGGHMLLRDPLVIPMAAKDRVGGSVVPFSRWARQQRRGLLTRAQTRDPRYPAKYLVRNYALRRLDGHLDSPSPVLLTASQLRGISSMTLSVGQVQWVGAGWNLLDPADEDALVFVVDDGSLPRDLSTLAADYPRTTWIVVGEGDESWWTRFPEWAHAVALAAIDPLSIRGPASHILEAVVALMKGLFTPQTFVRFLTLTYGDEFMHRVLEAPEGDANDLVTRAVGHLFADERIDTKFFDHLRTFRPRQWRDITSVEQMFVDVDRPRESD